ncbi:TetR/AcrR family transcriptional regulator [Streptosporangium roseum]|uniref:Transcriptional regulator, TetR family n=1 Tax=Streptosporangium roseum (strain ATCC 12428 / DSM 43021 / JCM 3005 / KCTC 9067 / NCIMB 10171 / NRRL 2505 / NI 9100) TaxID=479432 RepID=D2BAC5_STRRD|nr:TetR/AcrR family transcriptional regulator [Streptosporangium roseum]ACZ87950.1 putative transcriptional regulator, TetR family [Streptosporangium roseum DSM 43021]
MPPTDDPTPLRADARRNRERILIAAEAVFAEQGASASTEEVAARAGVAIGTVFRHFPTKNDLLSAIIKDLMRRLTEEADALADHGDPETALFTFFNRMVEQAVAKKTVADLLSGVGIDMRVAKPVQTFQEAIGALLARAQQAGTVRQEIRLDEVIALLAATCQAALHAGWEPDLQRRTLAIVFEGLRPKGGRLPGMDSA